MRDDIIVNGVTEEMVAAFLDGNATLEETQMILRELPHSDELQEIISIATGVDRDLALGFNAEEVLLKSAYAASSQRGNLCCWECEKHILNKHNIAYDEERLLQLAEENMWHCESGTPLDNVGRYLENSGMMIEKRFNCNINDIVEALEDNKDVIVAVDGGELLGDLWAEMMEDIFEGEKPDHTVVVLGYDKNQNSVTIYDPNSENNTDSYPVSQFVDAWDDSKNYMVTATFTKA